MAKATKDLREVAAVVAKGAKGTTDVAGQSVPFYAVRQPEGPFAYAFKPGIVQALVPNPMVGAYASARPHVWYAVEAGTLRFA